MLMHTVQAARDHQRPGSDSERKQQQQRLREWKNIVGQDRITGQVGCHGDAVKMSVMMMMMMMEGGWP